MFVNSQHDANSFSYICLFQFSICFEQPSAHHQRSQLYQHDLWYVTLCSWPCGMHITRSATYSDIYQGSCWYSWLPLWWALGCSKHIENWNKQIYEKELCVKLVIHKDCNKMHGQQNIKMIPISDTVYLRPLLITNSNIPIKPYCCYNYSVVAIFLPCPTVFCDPNGMCSMLNLGLNSFANPIPKPTKQSSIQRQSGYLSQCSV